MKKNSLSKVLQYEGNSISFEKRNDEMMVNATEMAKPFGKRVNDWLQLPSTKEYLAALETATQGSESNTRKSGNYIETARGAEGGTWMHRNLAIEFARWLNPMFAVWCNEQILTLMTEGKVELKKRTIGKYNLVANAIEKMSIGLNLNESSKALMYDQLNKDFDINIALPYIKTSDVLKSATELLKKNNVNIKTSVFNLAMLEKGILEKCEKNGDTFYKFTEYGLKYGENYSHPKSNGRIQTQWYESKFNEIVKMISTHD